MINVFKYDNATNTIYLDKYEILLVKEFEKLLDVKRNKCKEDSTGKKQLRAFREFKYMFLALDYKSPYFEYLAQTRHEQALEDAKLTDEEFNDPDFRSACKKYQELQNESRIFRLIATAQKTLEKLRIKLDNLDLDERDSNGKPIFTANQVIKDISSIDEASENLSKLENKLKRELSDNGSGLRGDNTPGFGEM